MVRGRNAWVYLVAAIVLVFGASLVTSDPLRVVLGVLGVGAAVLAFLSFRDLRDPNGPPGQH